MSLYNTENYNTELYFISDTSYFESELDSGYLVKLT